MYMVPVYEVGDRVYCVDNGPDDVGTVIDVGALCVYVEWDNGLAKTDAYAPSQLHIVKE